jgi:hypothetical protein
MTQKPLSKAVMAFFAFGSVLVGAGGAQVAHATEPCGDFGECKVLIEINSSDGDIGFHFLIDGDDLNSVRLDDPNGAKVFQDQAKGPLTEQKLTETFAESAEPLCWADPEADPDDEIVSLREFIERWEAGTYEFSGAADGGEKLFGETDLSYDLPAAPKDLDFDGSAITWEAGEDLGNCAPLIPTEYQESLAEVLDIIPNPTTVPVAVWEIVLEPDVAEDHPANGHKFTVRVDGGIAPKLVTVPMEYLDALPQDTPVKMEVGAIGADANATFTEADEFCVNEVAGCD